MKTKSIIAALLLAASSAFAQVPSYVPTSGLVGWWPFNGNANDESGNSFNGAIINGTQGAIQNGLDRNSNLNSALFFNNAATWNADGAYIELPSSIPNLFGSDFTISYWAKPTSANSACEVINKGRDNSGSFWNRFASGFIQTGFNFQTVNYNYTPIYNNWNCFTITKRGNTFISYINAQAIGTIVYQNPVNLSSNFWIGKHNEQGSGNGSTYPFVGYLDDVAFWNRSLSQQEIEAIFKSSTCNTGTISADGPTTFCSGNNVNLTFNTNCSNYVDSSTMIQNGWSMFKKFNGKEYWIYSTRLDYYSARLKCNRFGGEIFCVNSSVENDSVAIPISNNLLFGDIWLGLYQDLSSANYSEPSGGWRLVDNSTLNFSNWSSGNPNNVGYLNAASAENVVMDYNNIGDKWIDIGAGVNGTIVLERPIDYSNCATYQWKRNGINITTNGTSKTFKASSTGSYTCVATCNGTALTSNAIAVTSKTNATPSVSASGATSFCAGDSVTLNCTNLGSNYSVQWYRTNVSMENATAYSQVVKQPGTYKVVTKNLTNGCSRISGSSAIVAVNCRLANPDVITNDLISTDLDAKVAGEDAKGKIYIYPNPTSDNKFTVELMGLEVDGNATLEVYNAMGQILFSEKVNITNGTLNRTIQIDEQSKGQLCLVRLIAGSEVYDSKVILK